jgi:hypothetical protein
VLVVGVVACGWRGGEGKEGKGKGGEDWSGWTGGQSVLDCGLTDIVGHLDVGVAAGCDVQDFDGIDSGSGLGQHD